jgi:hypothetical protein
MIIKDRSVLEKLYNACIIDNINLEIGIYNRKTRWEYMPPDQILDSGCIYMAVFKLSNIGIEIDFKDVQLRIKKIDSTLPIELYKEIGQESVEEINRDISWLKSINNGNQSQTEAYRMVYFKPKRKIEPDERYKLFSVGIYSTIVPQGNNWQSASQEEFHSPILDVIDKLIFGEVPFTISKTENIELRNKGKSDLTITNILLSNTKNFNIQKGFSLPYIIPSGELALLNIKFSPSELGLKNGILTIQSTDPANSEVTISLIGEGVYSFRAIPKKIDFDKVPVSIVEKRKLELHNDGHEDVDISDIQIQGMYFSCETSRLTVKAGEIANIHISFSPPRIGRWTGALTIISNYSQTPEIEVELSGVAISWLTATPVEINFGSVALNSWKTEKITITNNGPSSCNIIKLNIRPELLTSPPEFRLGPLPYELPITLKSGTILDLSTSASPTRKGEQNGILIVSYSTRDISGSISISLKMTGV